MIIAVAVAIAAAVGVSYVMFSPPASTDAQKRSDHLSQQRMPPAEGPKVRDAQSGAERASGPSKALEVAPKEEKPARASEPSIATAPPAPPAPKKAPYQPGPSKFKNATDPTARTLLARVGADFDAETYWLSAINDPRTPANERKDLIEDLNEDGISDPSKPARQDLPLIQSRIQLIERLLPSTKDPVNAAAFREAHKDLVNMRDRLEQ